MTELEYVTTAIVAKVFQGDEAKRGAAEHIAQVAIKAGAEWHEQNFTEGIDQRYVRADPSAPCPSCGHYRDTPIHEYACPGESS